MHSTGGDRGQLLLAPWHSVHRHPVGLPTASVIEHAETEQGLCAFNFLFLCILNQPCKQATIGFCLNKNSFYAVEGK
jgi:hypothetical protein